jgi:hypothetical protein
VVAVSSLIAVMMGWGSPRASAATPLPSAVWTASKTTVNASGVAYTYTVMTATTSTLSKVTMTVPSGPIDAPAVGTVTPASITGNKGVTLSGGTLTYTFNAVTVAAGTVLSIQITGFANPLLAGADNSTITTENGSTAVDTGVASFSFTNSALTSPTWSASSTVVGAVNTTYTYGFTPSSALSGIALTITISVPPGTSGSPAIISTSPVGLLSALNVPTLNAAGTTLTITGTAVTLALGTAVTINVGGLTNTYTAGQYVSEIVTSDLGLLIDSGVTLPVTFAGVLALTTPATLTWSGSLTGQSQTLADTNAADEQLVLNDQTGSGGGWNISIAATNFTNGSGYSLPAAGVLEVTGSVTNAASTAAPTASCAASSICTLPTDSSVTYPQTITSAALTPAIVYVASLNTGIGPVTIGGSAAANPFGWWVHVPGYAQRGTYTATVTVSVGSGP